MTISAVADSAGSPPSVDVTMSLPTGSVMQSVELWRNDSSGRSLVRSQPGPGFDSRTVTDYECPYEENVTYDWAASYIDPAGLVTVFDETWASTAAWSKPAGSFNVSGGVLRNNSAGLSRLQRNVSIGQYRVTIGSMTEAASVGRSRVTLRGLGAITGVVLELDADNVLSLLDIGTGIKTVTAIDASQPIVVDMSDSGCTIVGTGGAYGASPFSLNVIFIDAVDAAGANQWMWGGIKVESYPAADTIAETSDPVQLDPANAWLVHPATPNASFPLTRDSSDKAGIVAIGPVDNGTASTLHRILGTRTPIATTTGPRYADQTTMTVALNTPEERANMRGLLASDTPILIQIPPTWGLEFNCGFYHVGDTTTARLETAEDRRRITLPLTRVQSPVVDVDGGDWTYADVAVEFDAYYELATAFDTYADLAANVRA